MVVHYLANLEDQGTAIAMNTDDVDAINMFGEGPLGDVDEHLRLVDAHFFHTFQNEFDDTDIN